VSDEGRCMLSGAESSTESCWVGLTSTEVRLRQMQVSSPDGIVFLSDSACRNERPVAWRICTDVSDEP
jgi:hypothetical protein